MKYIGVPRCPYCRKRVSFIRTWRLKREGEYRCPRCSGISNIFLSPLIYVFALVAIFAGGALYFFHKFILDDIEPMTALEVFIPFVLFFILSLFLVYLEKPMMKKVLKGAKNKKTSGMPAQPVRKVPRTADGRSRSFSDDEYVPRSSTQTGPVYQSDEVSRADNRAAQPFSVSFEPQSGNGYTAAVPAVSSQYAEQAESPSPNRPRPIPRREVSPVQQAARASVPMRAVTPVDVTSVGIDRGTNAVSGHSVSSVNISEDYFSKYDDPDYIQKRMNELQDRDNGS